MTKKTRETRWVLDFRWVNDLSVTDIFPTPNVSEILNSLSKLRYFSCLDASNPCHIRLNASKTHLFQEEVKYLGHLVRAEGVKLIPSYVQKIAEWLLPQTGKELSAFLGFTNYYHDFLPGFANG